MRLPDQVYIKREPRALLADFFLTADRYAAERGVLLSISADFDELLAVNRANLESWNPLIPSISPEYNDMTRHQAFWLRGESRETGKVVLARACRLYDLPPGRTMHDGFADFTLFYDDPTRAGPFEQIYSTGIAPRGIAGRFVMSVGGWHHPTIRKLNLSAIAPRVVRAWAHNEWAPPLFTSMVEDHMVEKARISYGMKNQEAGINWPGCPFHDPFLATLFWMTPTQLLEGLEKFTTEEEQKRVAVASERKREIAA
ncbi:MAG TPA: hypothetical protein VMU85_04360 [Stellaceae bacterium]|nr:hypothetical protein [Stellaceae bacterium]